MTPTPGNWYLIETMHPGKVLDVDFGRADDGTNIQQWTRHGRANQQFRFEAAGDGTYFIYTRNEKVLDVGAYLQPRDKNGLNVQQYSLNSGDNQRWTIRDAGDGMVSFICKMNDKALDLDGNSESDGGNIQIWDDLDHLNQRFKLIAV